MIQKIHIKNFKKFVKEDFLLSKNSLFIGGNDSGKSTIVEAIDIFFNKNCIPIEFVKNHGENVVIVVILNDIYYQKTYTFPKYELSTKLSTKNIKKILDYSFVYIDNNNSNPMDIISSLTISKLKSKIDSSIINKITNSANESINEVFNNINEDLFVVDSLNGKFDTKVKFNIENAFEFTVKKDNIPIEGYGSGFKKNLMYSLLIDDNYQNIILAIDDIENSFPFKQSLKLLNYISNNFHQTIITTKSTRIIEESTHYQIYPMFSKDIETINDLISSLDKTKQITYLLVEGKYDVPWYNKAISLLHLNDTYAVMPSGGTNMEDLEKAFKKYSKHSVKIYDGDTNNSNSIKKECIEMYITLKGFNSTFKLNQTELPKNKRKMFSTLKENGIGSGQAKDKMSRWAFKNLNKNSEFVIELKDYLEKHNGK